MNIRRILLIIFIILLHWSKILKTPAQYSFLLWAARNFNMRALKNVPLWSSIPLPPRIRRGGYPSLAPQTSPPMCASHFSVPSWSDFFIELLLMVGWKKCSWYFWPFCNPMASITWVGPLGQTFHRQGRMNWSNG